MTHKYIVSVPGRSTPICIEADSYRGIGETGARFFVAGDTVANVPVVDLIACSTCLPDFPDLSQFKGVDLTFAEPMHLEAGMTCEPVRAIEPLPPTSFTTFNGSSVPAFWPFLAGAALGFISGVCLGLSHAGWW